MSKITPTISNGAYKLIISESFCVDPSDPVTITIPASDPSGIRVRDIIIEAIFVFDNSNESRIKLDTEDQKLKIILFNINGPLPSGNTTPLLANLSGTSVSIFLMFQTIELDNRKSMHFTFTMYEGEKK